MSVAVNQKFRRNVYIEQKSPSFKGGSSLPEREKSHTLGTRAPPHDALTSILFLKAFLVMATITGCRPREGVPHREGGVIPAARMIPLFSSRSRIWARCKTSLTCFGWIIPRKERFWTIWRRNLPFWKSPTTKSWPLDKRKKKNG